MAEELIPIWGKECFFEHVRRKVLLDVSPPKCLVMLAGDGCEVPR